MTEGWPDRIDREIDALAGMISGLRRHLHRYPEPSREEHATVRHLSSLLTEAGLVHRVVPSGTGLIVDGGKPGSGLCVAIRADLDALLIQDAKEVSYKSARPGVMHACGHDAHSAMAFGAALGLIRAAHSLPERLAWRVIFQPAEEVGEGAAEMVEQGAVDGVDSIIALHVEPSLDVGQVGVREGVLTALCQDIDVRILGRGGHAARPHLTADPISAAALFVTSAYQAIPRHVDARDAVVVSFGAISGGTSHNVIPDRVELKGTLRTLGRDEAARVRDQLEAVARGVGLTCGVEIGLEFGTATDAVRNDPRVTSLMARAAAGVVGQGGLVRIPLPSMGGEDFSGYLSRVPGCMLRLGVGSGPWPRPGLHNPHFDLDERALAIGAKILARGVVMLAAESSPGLG